MDHSAKLLLDLFLIFAGAKLLSEIFERLRQPAVVGEILAGTLLGPSLLGRVAPAPLSVVCFRYRGSDEENRGLLERVNASGKVFLSHTVLNCRYVLRVAIGNLGTTREDVLGAWELIRREVR